MRKFMNLRKLSLDEEIETNSKELDRSLPMAPSTPKVISLLEALKLRDLQKRQNQLADQAMLD